MFANKFILCRVPIYLLASLLDVIVGSPRRLVWRHASQHLLNASNDWISSTDSDTLEFDYRVVCTGNYHGPRCSTFCRPRDDTNGHYRCSRSGTRVCLDGWSGTFCDRRKFSAVQKNSVNLKVLTNSECRIISEYVFAQSVCTDTRDFMVHHINSMNKVFMFVCFYCTLALAVLPTVNSE